MIKCHPGVDDSNFDSNISLAIKDAGLSGYVSRKTLREFFNLFSWVYVEGATEGAFSPNTRLEKFLSRFDLFRFKGDSLCYSAVLFYQKLSRTVDMRMLELDEISSAPDGGNKMFCSEDFKYKELYRMYTDNSGDLSTDFLLFNEIFRTSVEKAVRNIVSYGDVSRINEVTSAVRPDFSYRLATRQLSVNYIKENDENSARKLYVLQDCTFSIKEYLSQLKMIKAFILNEAFSHDFEVEWLFISDRINHRVNYNKANIASLDIQFRFSGTFVDTSKILILDEFIGKQVVIITDGTDMFNFPFNTKTRNLNVISFLDNINIKNKISNYGRFFKISL